MHLFQRKFSCKAVLLPVFLLVIIGQAIAQPTITALSPASGPVGTTVTISGSGFSTVAANNIVYFGGTKATVLTATANSLQVKAPAASNGKPVSVTTGGATTWSARPFHTTFAGGVRLYPSALPPVRLTTYCSLNDIEVADMDGDGVNELITGNYQLANRNTVPGISIYPVTSTGGVPALGTPTTVTASGQGEYVQYIHIADMDNDGRPDVVAAMASSMRVFTNNSTPGQLSITLDPITLRGINTGYQTAVSDINGDGKPDVLARGPNPNDSSVVIYLNESTPGQIRFAASFTFKTNVLMMGVKVADMDGDGKNDLLIDGNGRELLYRNTSTVAALSFGPAYTLQAPATYLPLTIADVNLDGKPDIFITGEQVKGVMVVMNNSQPGQWQFSTATSVTDVPAPPAFGDLTGDGYPEIVYNSRSVWIKARQNTSTGGAESFAPPVEYPIFATPTVKHVVADVTGDGKAEIISITADYAAISISQNRVNVPDVLSFSPTVAATGETVGIKGTYLTAVTAVSFGGVPAASFTIVSDDSIRAVVGAGATGVVKVGSVHGIDSLAGFHHTNPPVISSITPDYGKFELTVTIRGNYFLNATAVSFGDEPAASFKVISPTELTAVVGKGASGLVRVTTPWGTATRPGFVYHPAPTITGISPATGPIGTTITITGTHFNPTAGGNIVFFGPVRATVTAANATTLTMQVPAGADGSSITVSSYQLTAKSTMPFRVTFSGADSIYSASFDTSFRLPANLYHRGLIAGDFDGDGKADMVALGDSLHIFRNTSTTRQLSFSKTRMAGIHYPSRLQLADMNGDGKPDIVVRLATHYEGVVILINTSSGSNISFSEQKVAGPDYSKDFRVEDFDGDGRPDIIGFGTQANEFFVSRNVGHDGQLAFETFKAYFTNSYRIRSQVLTGDFNGDKKPDVIILSTSGVSTFINTSTPGNIQFSNEGGLSVGVQTRKMALGDLNNDGLPDLIVTHEADGNVQVALLQNITGPGTKIQFRFTGNVKLLKDPTDIDIIDLNGDGKPDAAILDPATQQLAVLRNTSSTELKFDAPVYIPVGKLPEAIAHADFDGDGQQELYCLNLYEPYHTILYNKTNAPIITAVSPTSGNPGTEVTITGANFTGITSVSIGNIPVSAYQVISTREIRAIAGEGADGLIRVTKTENFNHYRGFTFKKPVVHQVFPGYGATGRLVTITGDNFSTLPANNIVYFGATRAEVVFASLRGLQVKVPAGVSWQPVTVTAFRGTGSSGSPFIHSFGSMAPFDAGSFAQRTDLATTTSTRNVAICDFNNDGKPDLAALHAQAGTIGLFTNNSTASRQVYSEQTIAIGDDAYDLVTGDFNSDGKLDLAVGKTLATDIYLNTSSGSTISFAPRVRVPGPNHVSRLIVADIDGDARPDIVYGQTSDKLVTILRNTTVGDAISFVWDGAVAVYGTAEDLTAADLNGDGLLELIVAEGYTLSSAVHRNMSKPGQVYFASGTRIPLAGYASACAVGDLDGDGAPDLVFTNQKQTSSHTFTIFKNYSTGGNLVFTQVGERSLQTAGEGLAIADLNGDNQPDIIVADGYIAPNASIYRNITSTQGIQLAEPVKYRIGDNAIRVHSCDMNGDGMPDLLTANYLTASSYVDGGISILHNNTRMVTGVPDVTPSVLGIQVTPNPFDKQIRVVNSKPLKQVRFTLTDLSGRQLLTQEYRLVVSGSTTILETPLLNAGLYQLLVESAEGKTVVKLLKQ